MSQLDESLLSGRLAELIADARYPAAVALIEQSLGCGQDDAWLHGMRALLLLEAGDLSGALVASATAAELAPVAAFAHWTRGVVLLRAGVIPAAQRAAERAVALDGEESDTHVLLTRVYLQQSLWEQARMALADADAYGADEEELLPLRAAIAAGRGLEARAGETWRTFAQQYPANALARTGNAWTLFESGNVRAAHDEFQQARELDPTNVWAMEGLTVSRTRLLPVHRRWAVVAWGRLMQHREETFIAIGVLLSSAGSLLLAVPGSDIVMALLVTSSGAALPMLDAWRQDVAAT